MGGTTDISLTWVQTLDEAMAFKRWLGERRTWLAVDTETGGLDWWRDPLRTVQFGDRHHGWCMEWKWWAGLAAEALSMYDGPIAMHNSKFDTHFLETNGINLKRWLIHDTRAMAHILSPAERSGLKPRAAKVLGPWATHGEDDLKVAMTKGGWDWGNIPVELLWQYAAFDTVITAQLAEELYPWVAKDYSSIYELEIASTQVLTDMERRGILIDQDYLMRGMEEWGREKAAAEHELRERFHITAAGSAAQVMRALELESGWRPMVFTEKGAPKLDDEVMKGLADPTGEMKPSEVAKLVLKHREFHKLTNTYGRNILELTDKSTSRLHASINPLGARTGRMSVSRPSLQNLPSSDGRIRNAFTVEPANKMVKADYDQIEMRLFAHFSGDENMLAAIRYGDQMTEAGHEGYDFHSSSARMVWGIPWDSPVPKPVRKKVKGVGFGKVYGSGLETFAASSGLSLAEAQQAINAYESAFPESRRSGFPSRVSEALVRRERELGDPFVLTAYGRKEPCWPREAYKAVNYLIQGTAADVLKAKMVDLSRTWLGQHMLLPVHDEILFEVPEDAVPDAIATIQATMPERDKFQVPLTTDAAAVSRWGEGYDD